MKQSEARALIQSKITINAGGCWIWPTSRRYGRVMVDGKSYACHRLAYMAYHGAIGDKHVLHHCGYEARHHADATAE